MKKIAPWIPPRLMVAVGTLVSVNVAFALVTLYPTQGSLAWFDRAATSYVIHISVDGLGASYLQNMLNDASNPLPNFKKLRDEGAWTMNARTDYDYTITLPNHTGMLTGRPVNDKNGVANSGHHWATNITPPAGTTLQGSAGYAIASVFDVAHSNGLRTGLYATKEKFVLFKDSYAANIDAYANYDLDATLMMNDFLANMNANPTHYTFVHFNDTDTAGHASGWGSAPYIAAAKKVDGHLGQIFSLIQAKPQMQGKTKIILSTDHGGVDLGHGDQTVAVNYTIPMFIWGEGIAANSNLYTLNGSATQDPGNGRPQLANNVAQPIRNGDGGNCALRMLGLSTIPGSLMANLYAPCGVSAPTQPAANGFSAGATWKYLDNGSNAGTTWREANFNDAAWASGPAPLGYGDPVSTTINSGPANAFFITAYFRRTFVVTNAAEIGAAALQLRRDDGAVVYLNNIEVARSNMPAGAIAFNTLASVVVGNDDEKAFNSVVIPVSSFVTGTNIIAVEVHQQSQTSSDLVFDLALTYTRTVNAQATATPTATPTASPTARASTSTPTPTPPANATATPTPTATPTSTGSNQPRDKFVFMPLIWQAKP
ncbi:MAG: alkaline phosphatase family protein [Anaerolineae bacterium]|nr:alkaline phosphatase family protein [Anaerolineae bacterium]